MPFTTTVSVSGYVVRDATHIHEPKMGVPLDKDQAALPVEIAVPAPNGCVIVPGIVLGINEFGADPTAIHYKAPIRPGIYPSWDDLGQALQIPAPISAGGTAASATNAYAWYPTSETGPAAAMPLSPCHCIPVIASPLTATTPPTMVPFTVEANMPRNVVTLASIYVDTTPTPALIYATVTGLETPSAATWDEFQPGTVIQVNGRYSTFVLSASGRRVRLSAISAGFTTFMGDLETALEKTTATVGIVHVHGFVFGTLFSTTWLPVKHLVTTGAAAAGTKVSLALGDYAHLNGLLQFETATGESAHTRFKVVIRNNRTGLASDPIVFRELSSVNSNVVTLDVATVASLTYLGTDSLSVQFVDYDGASLTNNGIVFPVAIAWIRTNEAYLAACHKALVEMGGLVQCQLTASGLRATLLARWDVVTNEIRTVSTIHADDGTGGSQNPSLTGSVMLLASPWTLVVKPLEEDPHHQDAHGGTAAAAAAAATASEVGRRESHVIAPPPRSRVVDVVRQGPAYVPLLGPVEDSGMMMRRRREERHPPPSSQIPRRSTTTQPAQPAAQPVCYFDYDA